MVQSQTSPPPGGDHNRGPDTYGAVITISITSTAFVLARMYARIKVTHVVGWDDYTIVLAQFMNIATFIVQILLVTHGFGRHVYYLPLQNVVNVGLYFQIAEILYSLNSAVIKISACLVLLRIMARASSKHLRWLIYFLMGILTVLCIATAIVVLVQCLPIQAAWDPRIEGKCWSLSQSLKLGYAQNAWSILSDLACAGFPIIILWKLRINQRTKYALWFIMGLGLLSAICCMVKLVHLRDVATGDISYSGVNVNICAVLELNIGIIACCIPALQPLVKSLSSTLGSRSRPGVSSTSVLGPRPDLTANRSRSRHQKMASDDGTEQVLPTRDGQGIRKTTDVALFYHRPGSDPQATVDEIRMV
ncbi:hypothetical protein MMC07_004816 [Pseudocyphellaria aurata]|nr:hypothetical protein [Pseudocyphellaria aurata]